MRGYDREEEDYEDYDDYGEYQDEDVEEEGEEYEEGGEEYEEDARQPTEEEMEYLELRKRLKEAIRKKRKANPSSSQGKEKTLPYNNFGSFFGPSQPVISQRVIQESKSLLENQHLVSKMLSNQSSKKNSASNSGGSNHGQRGQVPKATSELRKKVEKLKVARDYSFLADDSEPPAPAKEPPSRNVSAPTSDARSAQMLPKSKQQLGSNGSGGRNEQGIRQERKSVPPNGQMHSKAATHKSSASKPSVMSMDSKRQLGVNGPGRPASASNGTRPSLPVRASNSIRPARPIGAGNGIGPGRSSGPKAVPSKMPSAKMEKKMAAPAARNLPPTAQKAPPSKMHSSGSKQHLELKKGSQERSNDKIMPQRPQMSSKPQVNRPPPKQVSSHSHTTSNVQQPKKKQHLSEDEKALMMIRNMFHTDRYPVYDDDDVSDMEANFEEIQREEKRSARIARKEDEEELKKIEEEERRERLRRQQAKKRKLA